MQVPIVKGKGPLLLLSSTKKSLITKNWQETKGSCAMQVVGTNLEKAKVLEKGARAAKCSGPRSLQETIEEDLPLDSSIVRPNLRALVTLPSSLILGIEIQILFPEIPILVPREILAIRIPVKINVSSVCFAKCC